MKRKLAANRETLHTNLEKEEEQNTPEAREDGEKRTARPHIACLVAQVYYDGYGKWTESSQMQRLSVPVAHGMHVGVTECAGTSVITPTQ